MCKIFDKNSTYTTEDVARAIYERHFEYYKDFNSCRSTVSNHFTQHGYVSVNGQKQHRVFSGNDCQGVFDYFDKRLSKREKASKASPKNDDSPHERVSVEFKNFAGDELERRSRATGMSKVQIASQALEEYFNNHPFDPYENMTREDLISMIERMKEAI